MGVTREQCEAIRADNFADDLDVTDEMLTWTESEVTAYFESGGEDRPSGMIDGLDFDFLDELVEDDEDEDEDEGFEEEEEVDEEDIEEYGDYDEERDGDFGKWQ